MLLLRLTVGMEICYALQVNYRYDLDRLTNNNQAYVRDREIAISDSVAEETRSLAGLWMGS